MKKIIFLGLVLASLSAGAQLSEGRQNVEKLCGCFDVDFKYAETFSPDRNYKFRDRKQMGARELALPIEASERRVVIQHVLLTGDSSAIKHWREDWVYEQPYLWVYEGDKKWVKKNLSPSEYKGKWTQTVWEVDDAPRYQGLSQWIATDGRTSWQNTTNAPLPRREYTTRNDYNILRRGNRIVLSDTGWTHEQDNDKVMVSGSLEKLVAQEKGYNIYRRLPDAQCAYAHAWWKEQSGFWVGVRAAWQDILQKGNTVNLQSKVDDKFLYQYLEELEAGYREQNWTASATRAKATEVLQKFALTSGGKDPVARPTAAR